jgi:signal transduction histidine kinase
VRGRIEQEGILDYPLPVDKNRVLDFPSDSFAGLPSVDAAQEALDAGEGRYRDVSLDEGDVRVYSMPVYRNGEAVAVIQVARSRYFVDATIARLLLIVAGAGAVGLIFSAGASFWLAGRTLQPIATALQRQRDFTADASHELRTPLALVRGNAELMLRHPEKRISEYDDVVHDIVDESDRLGRLVSDLLTLARADSGHVQIVRREVDLSGVAAQSLHAIEPLARAKGLTIRDDIAPGIAVSGDADRLSQLCLILLDNAVRYTPAGTVTLRLTRDGHGTALSVSDTGSGIEAEHLDRLFDRFYRVDEARSTEAGGTGLGLSIAKWIAEVHGGRISVASTPGAGSTFTVHLPRLSSQHQMIGTFTGTPA